MTDRTVSKHKHAFRTGRHFSKRVFSQPRNTFPPRAQLKLNVFKDVLDVFQLIRVINKKTKIDNYTFKTSRKLYVQNNTYYPQNVTSGSNTHTTCLKLYIQTYSSKYYLSALVCSLGQNQVQDKQFPFQCVQQAQLTGKHRNNNKPMALRITSNCKRNRERENSQHEHALKVWFPVHRHCSSNRKRHCCYSVSLLHTSSPAPTCHVSSSSLIKATLPPSSDPQHALTCTHATQEETLSAHKRIYTPARARPDTTPPAVT